VRCAWHPWLLVATLGLVPTGCERILGIDEIEYVRAKTDECVLPTDGGSSFRVGNLVPSEDRVDVCLRRNGYAWPARALLELGGAQCPQGVAYRQLTVPVSVPPGRYDVKLVRFGNACTASGRSLGQVDFAEGKTTSLLLFGEAFDEALVGALEDSPSELLEVRVRFVHALNGVAVVDAGVTNTDTLPAELSQRIFRDVPFGGVAPPQSGILPVREGGYMQVGTGEAAFADFPIGVAEAGDTEAMLVLPTAFEGGGAYSLFAIGTKQSTAHPPSLWVCDEKSSEDPVFARCGDPIDLRVDAFDPALTDLFTEAVEERTEPVIQALAQAPSDLMCITEVYPPDISARIVAGVKSRFAHAVDSNTLTGEDDRTGWDGEEPDFEGPFCGGDQAPMLDDFLGSLADSPCVERQEGATVLKVRGSEAISCVSGVWGSQFLQYLGGEDAQPNARCWMCAIAHLSGYESLESVRQLCTQDSHPFFAFRGATGLVVLSKHKLGEPELYLLPSTAWQRAVVRVPVRPKNGASFDFYCADLAYPHPDAFIPYVGPYGNGQQGVDGEAQEQLLEAQHLGRLVERLSTARGVRSVVAGVFFAGPAAEKDGKVVVDAQYPETWTELVRSLEPLVAADYAPACTWCADNPSHPNAGQASAKGGFWSTHLLGTGFSQADVESTERTFVDATLSFGATDKIPISPHYGLRSTLVVTQ
jgi:hypothetical protein